MNKYCEFYGFGAHFVCEWWWFVALVLVVVVHVAWIGYAVGHRRGFLYARRLSASYRAKTRPVVSDEPCE